MKRPQTTGDQHDFGAAKLVQIFASGMPYGVEEARLNAGEEAHRPVHHYEPDGSPLQVRNHPDWVCLDGRTHFNQAVSPDRLGKPFPNKILDANGWEGRDRQHWSSLVLNAAYLLTKSPSLEFELETEAQLYIAEHTLPSQKPRWSTNGIGASRGVGRTFLSLSWNYLATANTQLRDHMLARLREVVATQTAGGSVSGPVKPVTRFAPDPRQLMVDHWRPWEESLAVLGLEAAYKVTGEQIAHDVAVAAARTLIKYGWKVTQSETTIAVAVAWKSNGQPLTAAEYGDPAMVLWSYGTGFSEWALSAVTLAARFGLEHNDPDMMNNALYITSELHKARTKPRYRCEWDRFSEWEAVK